ncbi:MAG: hypothetical protein IPG96_07455 [Proteobacteria bacterium]|nr:hypothetical protein [Pseudomonadota bacterium]
MSTDPRPRQPQGLSLVAVLALGALGELVLRRVALHRLVLLRSDPLADLGGGSLSTVVAALDWLGLLLGYFTATLALIVAAAGLWSVVCGRRGHSRVVRLAVALAAGVLLPLVAAGLVGPLHGRLPLLLAPAAALTLLGLLSGGLADTRIAWRQRLGLAIVAAPACLQAGLAAVEPWAALRPWVGGVAAAVARLPGGLATTLAVAQALAVLPLFAWRPGRGRGLSPGAGMLALVPALTLTVLLFHRFGLVAQAAYEGLGIVLPLGETQNTRLLTLYALAGWGSLAGFTSLLREGPLGRGMAAGLVLVLAAGARWVGPLPVLLAIVGLLQLAACAPGRSGAAQDRAARPSGELTPPRT